jgi:zinc transporter, ZIP family
MAAAFGSGALGAAALLLGAPIAYQLAPSRSQIAMALASGLLIGSASFKLID